MCLFSCLPSQFLFLIAFIFFNANINNLFAQQLNLSAEELAQFQKNEKLLPYLVECALAKEDVAFVINDGKRKALKGSFGLAPSWKTSPLSKSEQKWVTACLLARTNYFGKKVTISTRADTVPHIPMLQASAEEIKNYSVYEAGFFGNIFSETPTAYACIPSRDKKTEMTLRDQSRICSIPITTNDDGIQISACRFIIISPCPESQREIIHVFTSNGK